MSIPVARYMRMSTDHQRYSIANQTAAIDQYAKERDLTIVRDYVDEGISGLTFTARPGLRQLISDVSNGGVQFRRVLVLDVSRWGRFQDPDEAAHYEFLCRSSGIAIDYCAEWFEGAGPMGNLLKAVKRVMAAEYSRELGDRTLRAQLHLARLGFKQGGKPRYGQVRALQDSDGRVKQHLQPKEWKSVRSDRVGFGWTSATEINVIRSIFQYYHAERRSFKWIAAHLNSSGYPSSTGGLWLPAQIKNVLRNDLVTGLYVFNKASSRLGSRQTANPRSQWVAAPVVSAIVDRAVFDSVQRRLDARMRNHDRSREALIGDLQRLYRQHGRVNDMILQQDEIAASSRTYADVFGGLRAAMRAAGFSDEKRKADRFGTDEQLISRFRKVILANPRMKSADVDSHPDLLRRSGYAKRFGTFSKFLALAVSDGKGPSGRYRWNAAKAALISSEQRHFGKAKFSTTP